MSFEVTASDILEIQNLIADFSFAFDYQERETFERLFAKDLVVRVSNRPDMPLQTFEGRDEFMRIRESWVLSADEHAGQKRLTRHFPTLSRTTVVDGEVHAKTGFLITETNMDEAGRDPVIRLLATGVYSDRFIREDGSWRFAERSVVFDPPGAPKRTG